MKNIILILFSIVMIGCNRNYEKSEFLGSWNCISSIDLETNELTIPEGEEQLMVEFRSDSLYLFDYSGMSILDDKYAWQIKGDSVLINDLGSFYIKELNAKSLTVEFNIIGETRMTFEKIKN